MQAVVFEGYQSRGSAGTYHPSCNLFAGFSVHRDGGFETLLSAAIIVLALGFLAFLRLQTGTGSLTSYPLAIEMRQVGVLGVGADVRVSGVKVGSVTDLKLNPREYSAIVRIDMRSDIALPEDSRFSVQGGIGSGDYLSITPGRSPQKIPPGGMFHMARGG